MKFDIKAEVRVRTDIWIDCCKRCMTAYEKEKVRQLRKDIDQKMKEAAIRVLRKYKDVEVVFK